MTEENEFPLTVSRKRTGLWIWSCLDVAEAPTKFFEESKKIKLTDVYLYLTISNYSSVTVLRKFISKLTEMGIRAWGLDGERQYFSDSKGPTRLYKTVSAMIAYNNLVLPNERFYGFQVDNEPDNYSGDYPDTFHNDIQTSKLSKVSGSGVTGNVGSSEYLDRIFILTNWLQIQQKVTDMLHNANLKSSAALPSWLDDYYGEQLLVTFNGINQNMMKHMFAIVDEYHIMSYQTNITKLISRIKTELTYGSAIGKGVFAGIETNKGRGPLVTYGDNPTKNTKTAVLLDIAILEKNLEGYSAFCGVNIHDFVGWCLLKE